MMKDASNSFGQSVPLMTAWNTESQIHLIIGANPLAAARCTKSLEAGATPILIAPETADLHFTLSEYISKGSVQWLRREFNDSDLTSLGREEVDRVVDMVFVTLGGKHTLSKFYTCIPDAG
jgi:uroporphyrin-III C-methyltransferase